MFMVERRFEDGTVVKVADLSDGATEVSLEVDEKKVSRTYVVPMLMRVGAAVVRMDGIGGVATDEEYRYRGYSRRVMETCVEVMRSRDAGISTLYGIQDFYPKYGYDTTGPEYSIHLELRDSDETVLPAGWRFRPLAKGDQAAVEAIYDANTRRAVGPLVRHVTGDELPQNLALAESSPAARKVSGRAWRRLGQLLIEPGEDACRVLEDESGSIVAYAWVSRGGWWIDFRYRDEPVVFHLGEVMALSPAAADAVLIGLRQWASERIKGVTKIELAMPPTDAVAMAAAYEGAIVVSRHQRRGQFMGRTLDTGRLLTQLQPALSERLRAARIPFQGRLTIRTDEGEATLSITSDSVAIESKAGGRESVVEMPQTVLARLTLGAFETSDLLARLPSPPHGDVAELLNVLFPRQTPHIYAIDRF